MSFYTFAFLFEAQANIIPYIGGHAGCRPAAKKRGPWELILYEILASQRFVTNFLKLQKV